MCFHFAQVMSSYFRRADPFFDEQENHSLIGVANVFLSCLFYDVKLQYAVPIINQKGEVGAQAPGSQKPAYATPMTPDLLLLRWRGVSTWRW